MIDFVKIQAQLALEYCPNANGGTLDNNTTTLNPALAADSMHGKVSSVRDV